MVQTHHLGRRRSSHHHLRSLHPATPRVIPRSCHHTSSTARRQYQPPRRSSTTRAPSTGAPYHSRKTPRRYHPRFQFRFCLWLWHWFWFWLRPWGQCWGTTGCKKINTPAAPASITTLQIQQPLRPSTMTAVQVASGPFVRAHTDDNGGDHC